MCYNEDSFDHSYFKDQLDIDKPQANETYVVDINSLTKDDFERSDLVLITRMNSEFNEIKTIESSGIDVSVNKDINETKTIEYSGIDVSQSTLY